MSDVSDVSGNNTTGALFSRRGEERGDLKMIETAIRHNWDIPEALFKRLPAEAALIALNKNMEPRAKIAAMRVILKMHEQNKADTPQEINVNHSGRVEHTLTVEERIAKYEDVYYEIAADCPDEGEAEGEISCDNP